MLEFATEIFAALQKGPIQAVVSLIILLVALPLLYKAVRDKESQPPASPSAPTTPIQVESPWMVIELNTISTSVQEIRRELAEVRRLVEYSIALIKNNNRKH